MNKGVSNIGRTNKVETPPAPPAPTVTAARNGLSLVGTFVELGSAGVNPLLHNTSILMGGFTFSFFNGFAQQLVIDPTGGIYEFGDINGVVNDTVLNINDNLQFIEMHSTGDILLLLDRGNRLYQIGDVSNAGNNSKIDISDASQTIQLDAGLSPGSLILRGSPGAESFAVNFATFPYLSLNPVTGQFLMGDIGGAVNNTIIDIEDSMQLFTVSSNGETMFALNQSNRTYQMGDVSTLHNETILFIDDVNQIIETANNGVINGLLLNFNTLFFRLGDIGNAGNETYLEVADASGIIQTNAGGVGNGLFIDTQNFLYQLGDFGNVGNNSFFEINDNTQTFTTNSGGVNDGILVDNGNFLYQFGDFGGLNNGSYFELNDNTGGFLFIGTLVRMNTTVGVGMVPAVSPFGVAALPAFANNAAAIVGGLNVGAFYRISVAGTSAVAVVE